MMRRTFIWFCAAKNLRADIEATISNINDHTLRPLDRCGHFVGKSTYSTPMVILLGNHSAGKSTFINKLLGQPEQHTGVAPTDDGFTVITRGDINMDEDGPSAVSNPALGFGELKPFGPSFVNHFRVKTRVLPQSRLPQGMMIIDTPGMIDTPVQTSTASRTSLEGQGRGYDFIGVTKWFAQRADVILLLFDPANPGTTGETLDVLTSALRGHEHKFLILFNKVDTFDQVVDFGRTYATLTWNLSKVIDKKDIPKIYTTFTETGADTGVVGAKETAHHKKSAVPIAELQRSVKDVIEEVLKAPVSRLDNLITEAEEAASKVSMSLKVQNAILSQHNYNKVKTYGVLGGAAFSVPAAMAILAPLDMTGMLLTGALLMAGSAVGLSTFTRFQQQMAQRLVNGLDGTFEEVYPIGDQTEDVKQRWRQYVRQPILDVLRSKGPDALQGASGRELKSLDRLMKHDLPGLRVKASEYKRVLLSTEKPTGQV